MFGYAVLAALRALPTQLDLFTAVAGGGGVGVIMGGAAAWLLDEDLTQGGVLGGVLGWSSVLSSRFCSREAYTRDRASETAHRADPHGWRRIHAGIRSFARRIGLARMGCGTDRWRSYLRGHRRGARAFEPS